MAQHIFGRTGPTLGGVFAADLVKVNLSDGLATTLMQSVGFNYAQQISRFYEIGGNNVYYVGGRTSGQMSIGRIIGPQSTVALLYNKYGDVCNAQTNTLQFSVASSACGGAGQNLSYNCKYCVISQIGVNVQAQDMTISEQVGIMFSSLEYTASH